MLCRGATVYVAVRPNIAEAESRANFICYAEAQPYMWQPGQISNKPRAEQILFVMPRRNRICGRQAKYRRSREQSKFYLLCRGATVYVAVRPNIAEAPEQSKFYLLCRDYSAAAANAFCNSAIGIVPEMEITEVESDSAAYIRKSVTISPSRTI